MSKLVNGNGRSGSLDQNSLSSTNSNEYPSLTVL